MNTSTFVPWVAARLAEAPGLSILLLKATLLLTLAWAAHAAFSGRNPRWRVALWRSTGVGLFVLPWITAAPPVATWRVNPAHGSARTTAGTVAPALRPDPSVEIRPVSGPRIPGESTAASVPGQTVPPPARPSTPTAAEIRPIRSRPSLPGEAPVVKGTSRFVLSSSPARRFLTVWIAGAVILAVKLLLSARRWSRVVERSPEAPGWVLEEAREVAARLGVVRGFRVVSSAEVRTPCVTGLRRPVLVLPVRQCGDDERADLRAILAHELAHARGRDLGWNSALHLASLLLWFHPLAWKVRSAHASACDAVCDSLAADLLGDVASYGRTLARLALRLSRPPTTPGLAMARTSDVRRRIESLQRKVHRSPLPRRLAMPALLVVSLLVVFVGGVEVVRVEAAPPQEVPGRTEEPGRESPREGATAPARPGRLDVRVTNRKTGEPLEGVEVAYRLYAGGKAKAGKPVTGRDGTAVVDYDPDARIESFTLTIRKAKFVPAHIYLDGSTHPIQIPATKALALDPGTTIGGVVHDEAGRPVEGATVSVTMPPTESDMANYLFHVGTPKTDARGRWRVDDAPADLGALGIRVEHPKYRHGSGTPARGLDGVTAVLTRGMTVTGNVVDPDGKPVKGARAVAGHDIWGTNAPQGETDGKGKFTLENCNPGPTIVTVQADGFSPQIRDVRVEEGGESGPVDFRLGPASVVRVRVVDVDGKPVPRASFAADTWRGHRSVMYRGETDADGRFEWKSAPDDAVQFDIYKSNFMRRRQHPIVASDAEQVVVLHPELSVSGRVTDAASGEPVPSFRVIRGMTFEGRDQVSWSRNEATEFTGGRYTERFDFPMKGWHLRVEAPGYKPADSRAFRSDEGRTTEDFRLERTAGLTGVVHLPDGKPAEGCEVALATRGVYVSLHGARFDRHYNFPVTRTGPDGRFTFPPPDDPYLLIAAHDAGFADATADAFAKSGTLVLRPWGRLEGKVMVGKKPGANQPVSYEPKHPERGRANFFLNYGYESRTDADGRFVFDRVVPGPGTVSRVVVTEFVGGSESHMPCWQEAYDVQPGGAVEVTVGGRGRAVIGKVVVDGTPDSPLDWRQNSPAEVKLPLGKLGQGPRGWDRYASNLDRDGRFRVDDVPPGRYELTVPVNTPPDPRSCGAGTEIGRATLEFTVPDDAADVPVDVGDVVATLLKTLKVGDPAPDFTATTLGGGRLKLSGYQGKLVLLDFWATWCGPCLAEMPAMKDLQEAFGADGRFVLVGMSCDEEPEAPARYARENDLKWTQAFAGNLRSGAAAAYLVRAIPATFLVAPDGRILAKNLRGAALKEAVRNALKDDTLFSAAKPVTRSPRFPVTRFDAPPDEGAPAPAPAVVVLDDCDEDLKGGKPHHDGLHYLGRGGDELRLLKDFYTCQSVGASHGVTVDAARGRVYVCELLAQRVTAFDTRGHRLWRVDNIRADALAVDPKTGNLWCGVGGDLLHGETVVLDPAGQEVASFPVRGIDLVYDPHTDGFWLAGYGVWKLSREGEVLFHKPRDGWVCVSVAADPRDGSVWVAEREHPDVARSANRLWHLDAKGGLIRSESLGKRHPFAVAVDPHTGTAWVVDMGSEVIRFAADGRGLPPIPVKATAVAISPTTGDVWLTTETEVLRTDEAGVVLSRAQFRTRSRQSRLAAF